MTRVIFSTTFFLALALLAGFERARAADTLAAVSISTRAKTVAPDEENPVLESWFVRVEQAKERGDDARAALFCIEALREFPGNAGLLNALATAQNRIKDFKGGLKTANEAIALDQGNAVAHANRAFAYAGLGDNESMVASLRTAVGLDPRFEDALKSALAGNAVSLFAGLSAAPKRRAPLPKYIWILVPAAVGFVVMLLIVLAARGAPPEAEDDDGELPQIEVEPGTLLAGRFRVDSELGEGGTGLRAFDEKDGRKVAIKRIERDDGASPADLARFAKEAKLIASLKHPGIAELLAVLDLKGEPLLVYEYVEGRTLDKHIWATRKLTPARAEQVLAGLAFALDTAHSQKIVHRDLKPTNVIIGKDGSPRILDFGVAHQAVGAEKYAAPEQGLGNVSTSADLFALGVIAYEMIFGAAPFDGPDFLGQKLHKAFVPASQRDPALPIGYDAFFAAALDPDPAKRPASGAALVDAFRRAR